MIASDTFTWNQPSCVDDEHSLGLEKSPCVRDQIRAIDILRLGEERVITFGRCRIVLEHAYKCFGAAHDYVYRY